MNHGTGPKIAQKCRAQNRTKKQIFGYGRIFLDMVVSFWVLWSNRAFWVGGLVILWSNRAFWVGGLVLGLVILWSNRFGDFIE